MSTQQNKAVVRRFIKEVLAAGNIGAIDDLLAPNYMNRGMGDLASFKAALSGMAKAVPERHFEIEDLIAEGDAVVARYTSAMTLPGGKKLPARGLTYYRLAHGKIVEDDPMTMPDLMKELASLVAPSTEHRR